jgi:hypothetical protein
MNRRRAAKAKLEGDHDRAVARTANIRIGASRPVVRRLFRVHLFFKPRWKDDEFVRVVEPKTVHRVDEQSVCQG